MKKVFQCLAWQNGEMEIEVVVLADNKEEAEKHLREEFGSGYDLYDWEFEDSSSEVGILVIAYPNQGV